MQDDLHDTTSLAESEALGPLLLYRPAVAARVCFRSMPCQPCGAWDRRRERRRGALTSEGVGRVAEWAGRGEGNLGCRWEQDTADMVYSCRYRRRDGIVFPASEDVVAPFHRQLRTCSSELLRRPPSSTLSTPSLSSMSLLITHLR